MLIVVFQEQYIAIFLALNEIVKSPIEISTVAEFTTRAVTMTTDKLTNQSLLRKEFQVRKRQCYLSLIYSDFEKHLIDMVQLYNNYNICY